MASSSPPIPRPSYGPLSIVLKNHQKCHIGLLDSWGRRCCFCCCCFCYCHDLLSPPMLALPLRQTTSTPNTFALAAIARACPSAAPWVSHCLVAGSATSASATWRRRSPHPLPTRKTGLHRRQTGLHRRPPPLPRRRARRRRLPPRLARRTRLHRRHLPQQLPPRSPWLERLMPLPTLPQASAAPSRPTQCVAGRSPLRLPPIQTLAHRPAPPSRKRFGCTSTHPTVRHGKNTANLMLNSSSRRTSETPAGRLQMTWLCSTVQCLAFGSW